MPTTDPATLSAKEREEKVLSLRVGGATLAIIGAAVGLTPQGARAALMRALRRHAKLAEEDAEVLRAVEVMRLDRAVTVATAIMLDAKASADTRLRATDRLIRAGERRCALLGLDAPRLHKIALGNLTEGELEAIAAGQDPLQVLASRPLPPMPEPPPAPPADDEDDDAELGQVVGDEVVF